MTQSNTRAEGRISAESGQERIVGLVLALAMTVGCVWLVLVTFHLATTHGPSYRWSTVLWLTGLGVAVLFGFRRLASFGLQKRAAAFALALATFEGTLQLLALAGWLPGIDLHTYCPFGRAYVTSEGSGNSISNRYGWYYPSMSPRDDARRVALIGDSFVQGLGVQPHQNAGILLEGLLSEKGPKNDVQVFAFGISGAGPAQYLELLRYAHQRFDAEIVLLCIFLGNDFRNVSLEVQGVRPDAQPGQYLYYRLGTDGDLVLVPGSGRALQRFWAALDDNHRPLLFSLARTLRSHFLSARVLQATWRATFRQRAEAAPHSRRQGETGLDELIFRVPPSPEARAAEALMRALLDRCLQVADEYGIELRIVTIPHFPPRFFEQTTRPWTTQLEDQDLLRPERVLESWARSTDTPALFLGSDLQKVQVTLSTIRTLYFDGSGHFTVEGHRFLAERIAATFP